MSAELQKEIKDGLAKLATAVTAVQEKHTEMEGKVDALDTEHIKKAGEEATKALELVNSLTEKQTAQEKLNADAEEHLKELELQIAKGGKGADDMLDEKAYRNELVKHLRKGTVIDDGVLSNLCTNHAEKSLIGVDEGEKEHFVKTMVAASGPDGGYFITTDRADKISTRIFESSPVRGLASTMTTNSDVFEMLLDDDEASGGWVGEVQARPDTDSPQVALIKIPVHELYAQPKATQKMLDDAGFDIEAWLSGKVSRKLGRLENTSFVVGDGSQKPKGFLTYADWTTAGTYQRNAVEQLDTAAASVIAADDLIELQNMLIEDYQAGASWGMRRATFTDIMTLKASTSGNYLINPRIMAEGAAKVLLGNPINFMADMPAVADSALPVVYADFQEFYTIVDRFGIRVLRDPYTDKPNVRFYTTKRVGGAVTNYEAGKILKITAA